MLLPRKYITENAQENIPPSQGPSPDFDPEYNKLVRLLIEDGDLNGLSDNTDWLDLFPAPIEENGDLSPRQIKRVHEHYEELQKLFGKQANSATGGQLRQSTSQGSITENSRDNRAQRPKLRQGRITQGTAGGLSPYRGS